MASMCKCCKKNDDRVQDVIQVREARLNLTPQTEQQQEDGEQQYGFLTRCLIYSILGGSVIIILVVALSVALTLESSKDLSKQRDKVPLNESLEWSEWEACSKPCGNGTRTRQLNCSTTTGPCDSSVLDTQDCNTHACPADYSQWGPWSSCSVTCGGGWQVRNRTCIVEVCSKDKEENRVCNQQHCDFSPWGPWSSCSVTCEGGLQVRNRTCINQDCSGVRQENRVCNEQTCDFSQWNTWSSCSVTCGEGSQLRIRICRIQECSGISEENRGCTQQPCEFSNWGPWSTCTVSCGGGCQLRNRTCIVQQCTGITQENRVCNEGSCEGNLRCSRETLNICSSYMKTWRVRELKPTYISLDRCSPDDLSGVSELLLLVGRSQDINNYGKYEVIKVNTCAARSCVVPLATPLSKLSSLPSTPCEIRAQRLTTLDNVTLMHWCTLTCHSRPGSFGNVLALRATTMLIDSTSQIDVTGKGYLGGIAGFNGGSGGHGGETYRCERGSIGKGGSGGQDGVGGGGAGDGFQSGGPGGYHAGGGGGVSATDNDGAGGGGGGGHFSGGGGGGSGNGYEGPGGKGGFAVQEIGRFAGGGGDEGCPANDGRNNTLIPGGRDGTAEHGGTGGDTRRGSSSGAAGGGGGFQYGSLDFENTLSYGGGGGGGGGSAFGDGNIGGLGGNGGGIVLLFLKTLTLNGKINANGEKGRCPYEMTTIKSGSGGSGAGGSVIIYTDVLHGDPSTKITVDGGPTNNDCTFGSGGGGGGGVGRWVIKTNDSVLTSGG